MGSDSLIHHIEKSDITDKQIILEFVQYLSVREQSMFLDVIKENPTFLQFAVQNIKDKIEVLRKGGKGGADQVLEKELDFLRTI